MAFTRETDHVNDFIEHGFRFIGVGSDNGFLAAGCRETLAKIRR